MHPILNRLTVVLVLTYGAALVARSDAAPPLDDRFVTAVDGASIGYTSRAAVIAAGHLVCTKLDAGESPTQVANDVMTGSSLDGYHAGFFTGVSIAAFCPQYGGQLQ